MTSTRTATYATGGQLTITPTVGLPCLDGEETLIPWYNAACKGKQLPALNSAITLDLEDSPSTKVPSQAHDATNVTRNITGLTVAESFLVTLYNNATSTKIKQWTWSYNYKLTPNAAGIYAKPVVVDHAEAAMAPQNPMSDIVVVGPVATAAQTETWTSGWGKLPG